MKSLWLAAVAAGLLGACAPQTKYDWGSYQPAMIAYYRAPANQPSFDKAIADDIARGEPDHRVPPGLYAEAGYEAWRQGDTRAAIADFQKEETAWPESAFYMNKTIAGVTAAAAAPQHPAS